MVVEAEGHSSLPALATAPGDSGHRKSAVPSAPEAGATKAMTEECGGAKAAVHEPPACLEPPAASPQSAGYEAFVRFESPQVAPSPPLQLPPLVRFESSQAV